MINVDREKEDPRALTAHKNRVQTVSNLNIAPTSNNPTDTVTIDNSDAKSEQLQSKKDETNKVQFCPEGDGQAASSTLGEKGRRAGAARYRVRR